MPVTIGVARSRVLINDLDGDGQPDPGDAYSYELIVTNSGDTAATGVAVDATQNGYTISNVLIGPYGLDDTIGVTVAGNTPYTFNASALLGNDLDPDDGTPNLTITHIDGTAIVTGVAIDVGNATVTRNGDGTFTIRPDAGFEGVETFTYNTVDSDGIASVAATPAVVTVNVGEAVWYIDSTGGNDVTGNGTFENPFASLAPLSTGGTADALDDSNDTIFVYANGANAYNSGIVLEQGQVLRGEGVAADFVVNGITISSVQTDTQLEYTTFGAQLNSGNAILGIDFVGEATGAVAIVDGAATVGTLTVSDVEVSGQGQIIDVDQGGALSVTLESAASTGSTGANGGVINLAGVTGTFTVSGATAISGTHGQGGIAIGGAATNIASSFAGGTTLNLGAQGGVNLTTNAGSTTFTGLDITTTTGTALASNAGGTLTVTGASNDIATTTGTAINFATATVGAGGLNFATVSTNGAANGVLLSTVGQAAGSTGIDILGGTIVNASTRGVDIASTSADVAIASTISTTASGRSVEVTDSGRAVAGGSTIVFSGAIDENGLGINLDNNDQNTNGAVISFSGGLDIDSTTSTGFSATNGGTINVTGTNTINNTTGTGLNVQNTTIGASDLTFQQISVNGAANGIVLNNTGTSGGLTVTGTDGADVNTFPDAGSGGTIQNTTGDGILLTTTMDLFLGGMTITSNDGDGIGGSGVNGFVLDGVTITGNGTTDATDESGININELTGTAIAGLHPTEIRNSTISNNFEFEIQITNSTGTLNDFRLTNSTVSSNGATTLHGNLFNFLSTGTASMGLTVAGSTFTGSTTAGQLTGTGVSVDASGGTIDADIGTSVFTTNNVGVNVSAATTGALTFNVSNNVITGSAGNAINFFTNANNTAASSGTIANNTVGTQGVAGSGSTLGRGIRASNEGSGTTTLLITANTVQSIATFDGLFVFKGVTAGTMNATITNNIFRDIPNAQRGMNVQTGILGSVLNTSITGNQFINVSGSSGTVLRVAELPPVNPGTVNLTQTSNANLSALNNGVAVATDGAITFGAPAPPLPLLFDGLPGGTDDSVPAGDGGAAGGTPDEPVVPGVDETDTPAGDGDDTGGDPLPPVPSHPVIVDDAVLSQAELDYLLEAAIARWVAVGATDEQVAAMRATAFTVADMSANYLAASQPGTVQVDSDGAGHGWFLDGTPGDDAEYHGSGTLLTAASEPAAGQMDLLTVLMHELGHQVGLADVYSSAQVDELMYGYASLGTRRLPAADDLAGADPSHDVGETAFVVLTPTIGALPAGRAVRVVYTATVNNVANQVIANPFSNNVTIQGGNFVSVVSSNDTTTVDSLTLGGTVWFDNGAGVGGVASDGIKNGTEAGIGAVTLSLFADATNDDVPDGAPLATTTTNGSGDYAFSNLAPGNYIVRVDSGNFSGGNPLANRGTSPGEPDPDNSDPDTDNDDNGYASGGAVLSHHITLAYNSEPTGGTGNDTNLTLDFGFGVNNQLPVFTGLDGTPAFTENGAAVVLDSNATVSDPDLTASNYAGATLTLARSGGANAADLFGRTGTLTFVGADVLVGATTVGTFTQSAGTLVITFNSSATQALVNSTLQQLTYSNTSDNPGTSAVVAYVFSDGNSGAQGVGGALTATGSVTVSITTIDDAPVAQPDAVTTPENVVGTGSVFANNGSGADVDVDGPALAVSAVNGVGANVGTQITLASGAKLTLNADGTYSYDPNGKFNYLISPATAATTFAVNTSAPDSFTYTLTGGNTVTVTMTVTGVDGAGDQLWGNSGNNTIVGTPAGDLFNLSQGGDDTATGLGGIDGFYMGAALSPLDSLDGGAGILDQLGLQGNYGSPFVLSANHLVNIEALVLLPGNDTRFGDTAGNFYSYNIATVDANVASGERLVVAFNTLRVGENVVFDGSDESDGWFFTFGGLGNDTITGGDGDDGFYFGNNDRWGAGDSVDGGAGADQFGLQGNYSGASAITFGAAQITGIEMFGLLTGGDARFGNPPGVGYSYDLTMDDGNVASGATLYVSANTLRAGVAGVTDETLTFDGSDESDGRFTIYSGAGDDTIIGGDNDDTIFGAGGADTMTGGLGSDTFAYINAAHSTLAAMDQILDFGAGDKIGLATIDAITGGANDAFTFIGSGAFSNTAGELRAFDAGGGVWQVQGDIDGNGVADLVIAVTTAAPLVTTDFVL